MIVEVVPLLTGPCHIILLLWLCILNYLYSCERDSFFDQLVFRVCYKYWKNGAHIHWLRIIRIRWEILFLLWYIPFLTTILILFKCWMTPFNTRWLLKTIDLNYFFLDCRDPNCFELTEITHANALAIVYKILLKGGGVGGGKAIESLSEPE